MLRLLNHLKRKLPAILCFSMVPLIVAPSVMALNQTDIDSIYKDTVWYDNSSSASGSLCSGESSDTNLTLTYPANADPAQVGKNLETWINKNAAKSPWLKITNFGSRFATQAQQMNVNPYLITAIANQETNVGLTGSALTNNNSFGEKISSSTYRTWPSFEASLFGSGSYTEIFRGNITGKSPLYKDVKTVWEYLSMHLLGKIIYPGDTGTFFDPATGKTINISYLQTYYSNVEQWIGEMTGTTINVSPPSGPSGAGSCTCVQAEISTAKDYSWPTFHPAVYLTKTDAYAMGINKAISGGVYTAGTTEPYAGIDCGAFVTVAMVESGADPNYNGAGYAGNTDTQQRYLNNHPDLYENLGTKSSTDGLQPGDIAINSEHTYIFVGNEGYQGYSAVSASTGPPWRSPMADNAYFSNSAGPFTWYRLKCPGTTATP